MNKNKDNLKTNIADGWVVTTRFDADGNVISSEAGKQQSGGEQESKPALASYIDHTLLKANATSEQIIKLCNEAKQFHFASVCVNPMHVSLCAELLRDSGVKVGTVVGFPLGANKTETKVFETQKALQDGANEIDMVMNIGALKSGNYSLVSREISDIVRTAHQQNALVKVILETSLLNEEEKIIASLLAVQAGADYVKTSTGFSSAGATVEDVALMRRVVGKEIGVKAAGGIRSLADAKKMISAGATRLGASAGVEIVSGLKSEKDY
jgi:deoxyribose-phosphate aldolase